MDSLTESNKLTRVEYLLSIAVIFSIIALSFILNELTFSLINFKHNMIVSKLILVLLWFLKLKYSAYRLLDIGLCGWWIIMLLPFNPLCEIVNLKIFNCNINGLIWIIPFLLTETLLITLPGGEQTHILEQETALTRKQFEIITTNWNWGPFALTFLWAIYYRFWLLAIVSLIPGIGLLIGIILAIVGNEWAWQKNKQKNYATFIAQQQTWNKIGVIYSISCCVVIALSIILCAYNLYVIPLLKYIKINYLISNNAIIINTVGKPVEINSFKCSKNNNITDCILNIKGHKFGGKIILQQNRHKTTSMVLILGNGEKITVIGD